jgi:hypothetical protein
VGAAHCYDSRLDPGWRGAYSFTTVEGLRPQGEECEEEWKESDYILLTTISLV